MALSSSSLFVYGFEVTIANQALDFASSALQTPSTAHIATLNVGFYSLSGLATEIARAMNAADTGNTYSVSIDRTVAGGYQNRVTITTSGGFLTLFFGTGLRAGASCASLIGFAASDRTGATSYIGVSSAGSIFTSTLNGYNYLPPTYRNKLFGSVNVSAIGEKEAISFNIQKFVQVEYKYEPASSITSNWVPFLSWAIQQRKFEFTPEVSNPTLFYEVTLESSVEDGKGLGFRFKEQLPQYPNIYETGQLVMRVNEVAASFII